MCLPTERSLPGQPGKEGTQGRCRARGHRAARVGAVREVRLPPCGHRSRGSAGRGDPPGAPCPKTGEGEGPGNTAPLLVSARDVGRAGFGVSVGRDGRRHLSQVSSSGSRLCPRVPPAPPGPASHPFRRTPSSFTCDDGRVALSALRLHPQLQGETLPRDVRQRLRSRRQRLPAAGEVQGGERPAPGGARHPRRPAPQPALRLAPRLLAASPGCPRPPTPLPPGVRRGCGSEPPLRRSARVQPVRMVRGGRPAARSLQPARLRGVGGPGVPAGQAERRQQQRDQGSPAALHGPGGRGVGGRRPRDCGRLRGAAGGSRGSAGASSPGAADPNFFPGAALLPSASPGGGGEGGKGGGRGGGGRGHGRGDPSACGGAGARCPPTPGRREPSAACGSGRCALI